MFKPWNGAHCAVAIMLTTAALLSGCATVGKSYNASNLSQLEPGKTSKAQVVTLLGAPREEETKTLTQDFGGKDLPQPAIINMLRYSFGAPSEKGAVAGSPPYRWTNVMLINGVVQGYLSSSSFAGDDTNFETTLVSQLEKGKSNKESVAKLLGQPSGQGLFPFAASSKGSTYFYSVDLKNFPVGSNTRKRLQVYFDANGVVEDFTVEAKAVAAPVAPVPTTIPIYIPVKGK